jgi:NADH:ubiquinone oxidoreductase subunit E
MDPVDIHELPKIHQGFARDIERTNKLRVNEMFRKIYQGLAVLTACTFFVVGVYYYGCYLMGNESLLEEIDEEVALERGELEMDEQGNLRPAKDTAIHR